ncbi:MAG TPA: TetR/AcrR family transcriptional regulator [Noviherbaspirillum sp.]
MDERKNRESWLGAGLTALAEEGPQGLRIMPIAARLGVTKGSFYWHFKNLEDYQSALLEEWEQCHTQAAIECVERIGGDASTKLRHWITGSVHADFRLDRAIRTWSLTDQRVLKAQGRVDAKRIEYLAKLLCGAGWSRDDARMIGQWTYWAWIGYSTLGNAATSEKQLSLILSILEPR